MNQIFKKVTTIFLLIAIGFVYSYGALSFVPPASDRDSEQSANQANVVIQNTEATAGESLTVTVYAQDIYNMRGFQWTIIYDSEKLSYTGHSNWAEGIGTPASNSDFSDRVTFLYNHGVVLEPVDIVDGIFFELTFDVKPDAEGEAYIMWSDDPTEREIHNSDLQVIDVNWIDGLANLQPIYRNVNVTVNPDNTGTVNGDTFFSQDFKYGSLVELQAESETGYEFENWTENETVVSEQPNYSFEITEDRSFTANFKTQICEVLTNVQPQSSGTVGGGGMYVYGSQVFLSAEPAIGYNFVSWTEGGTTVSEEPTYSFTVQADRNLQANFALQSFEISAVSNPPEGGSTIGGGSYNYNETAVVEALSEIGYTFVSWTEGGTTVSEEPTYSFTVQADHNLQANFELQTYDITTAVFPENSGITEGAGTYNYAEIVSLKAVSAEGFSFNNWTENGEFVSADSLYVFTAKESRLLQANFTQVYAVNAVVTPENSGNIIGTGVYDEGETAVLDAQPAAGHGFMYWLENDEIISTEPQISFIVNESRIFNAVFSRNEYQLQYAAENNGFISGNTQQTVLYGDHGETVEAVPDEGFHFTSWSDGIIQNSRTDQNITADINVTAFFEINTYSVSLSALPIDAGTVSGAGLFEHGQAVDVSALPFENHDFKYWTEEDTIVSDNPNYRFLAETNRELTAHFELRSFDIELSAFPFGAGVLFGGGSYHYGEEALLEALPETGYTFVNWTEGGMTVSEEPTYSFTVQEGRNLQANFELQTFEVSAVSNPAEGGNITGGGLYKYGETAELSALPNTDYAFMYWCENDSVISKNPAFDIPVEKNHELTANFKQKAILSIENQTCSAGDTIMVKINAKNINDLAGFQWTINYDYQKLSYAGSSAWHEDVILSALVTGTAYEGKITFAYSSLQPINIANDIFFELVFIVNEQVSGNAHISWADEPTMRELNDSEPEIIPTTWQSGNLTVYPLLYADPTAQPQTACFGDSIRLLAQVGGGTGDYSYLWTTDTEDWFSEESNPKVLTFRNTMYYVIISDGYSSLLDSVSVELEKPQHIETHPADIYLSENEEALFEVKASGTNLSFQWRKDGIVLQNSRNYSGVNSPQLIISSADQSHAGIYDVRVSGACGDIYSDSAELFVALASGNAWIQRINVFPNPTSGVLNIEFPKAHKNITIQAEDFSGRLLWAETIEASKTFRTNMGHLPSGIYFIKIYTVSQSAVFKIFLH